MRGIGSLSMVFGLFLASWILLVVLFFLGFTSPEPPASQTMFEVQASSVGSKTTQANPPPVYPPKGRQLQIKQQLQLPELPNGCEATTLAMLLDYQGYPADKISIATHHLPKTELRMVGKAQYGPNPETAYPGQPNADSFGYYCYPPVLAAAAESFLDTQRQATHTAKDISGASLEQLLSLLDSGIPAAVWSTVDHQPPRQSEWNQWYLDGTEQLFVPFSNLHVLVLSGYDDQWLYFCDPLGETNRMKTEVFSELFAQSGRRALILTEASTA